MRILLMASVACSLALAGCGGGTKNSSATNNSTSANTSTTATNSSAPAAGGTSAIRAGFIAQCEQAGRADPRMPAGFDITGACGCAYEKVVAGNPNPQAVLSNPETGPAVSQAVATCIRERMGAGGAAPAAGGEEAAEEEGAEEK